MRLWASANRRMEGGMFFCVGMDMMVVVVVVVDALHGVGVSFFSVRRCVWWHHARCWKAVMPLFCSRDCFIGCLVHCGCAFFFLSAGPWARNAGGCRACVVVWRWRGFCCARAGPSGAHRGRALGAAGPDRCGGGLCGHGAGRRGERGGATKYVPGPPKYVPPPSKGQTKHVHFSRKMYGENEFAHVSWSCPWIGLA